jgi:hypothetical protein
MHGLGQLLGLPGQLVELCDGIHGRIGKGRVGQHDSCHREACDRYCKPPVTKEFSEGHAVKIQDYASL